MAFPFDLAQLGIGGGALALLGMILRSDHRHLVHESKRREDESQRREDALLAALGQMREAQASLVEVLRENSRLIRENTALFNRLMGQLEVVHG